MPTKTIRIDSDQAGWLASEAARAKVSENRIIGELISQAMEEDWRFGVPLMHSPPPSHPVHRNPLGELGPVQYGPL